MATVIEVTNQSEFLPALQKAGPGTIVKLWPGRYILPQIVTLEGVTLEAADGSDPLETRIITQKGIGIRGYESSFFNLSFAAAGGNFLSLEGPNNVVSGITTFGGDRAIKVSGTGTIIENSLFIRPTGNGIDINGGIVLIPEISPNPINLQNAMNNPGKYTPEQMALIEHEFYHRDMKVEVRYCSGYRCGYAGGTWTGAFIKAVPGAGGILVENCNDFFSANGFWNDFPSSAPFIFRDNVAIGTAVNAFFVEGSRTEGAANCQIYRNAAIGAKVGLFVSAFPDAETWGNIFAAYEPKKIHGIKGSNPKRVFTKSYVREGEFDYLVAMNPEFYRAHSFAWTGANYDTSRDKRFHIGELLEGAFYVETEDAPLDSPRFETDSVQIPSVLEIPGIDTPVVIPNLNSLVDAPFMEEVDRVYRIKTKSQPGTGGTPGGKTETDAEKAVQELSEVVSSVLGTLQEHESRISALESAGGTDPGTGPGPDPIVPDGELPLIIFDNDGNAAGKDTDNIAATPIAALVAAAAGIQNRTFFFVNNWQAQPSDPALVSAMREGLAFADRFGIRGFDYEEDTESALSALIEILETGRFVYYLVGGRLNMLQEALRRWKPSRVYQEDIVLISHSRTNEGNKWEQIRSEFPFIQLIQIADQNAGLNSPDWQYLDSATEPELIEARRIMKLAGEKKDDASDVGPLMWVLENKAGTFTVEEIRAFIEKRNPKFQK